MNPLKATRQERINPIVQHKNANDELNLYANHGIPTKVTYNCGTLTYPRESIDFVVDALFTKLLKTPRAISIEELYQEATGFYFRDLIGTMQGSIGNRLEKRIRAHKQQHQGK